MVISTRNNTGKEVTNATHSFAQLLGRQNLSTSFTILAGCKRGCLMSAGGVFCAIQRPFALVLYSWKTRQSIRKSFGISNPFCQYSHEVAGSSGTFLLHGIWQKHGKGDSPQRNTQAIAFAIQIANTRHGGDDTIACGDFNVLPNSITFEALNELGLRDLVVANGHTDTRTSYYPESLRYADYMFASLGLQIEKFDIPAEPEVSDHRPLILDLK